MPSLKQQKKKEKKQKPEIMEAPRTLEDLKALGNELLTCSSSINNLPRLLALLSPSSPPEFVVEVLLAVQPFFITLLPEIYSHKKRSGRGGGSAEGSDPEVVYREWLRTRFDGFVDSLIEVAVSPLSEDAIRDVAIDAIMEFVKLGKGRSFQFSIYYKFLDALVYITSSVEFLLSLFAPKFFKYMDVRYYTYSGLSKIANKLETASTTGNKKVTLPNICTHDKHFFETRAKAFIHNIYVILSQIPSLESQDDEYVMWSESGFLSNLDEQALSSNTFVEEAKHQKSKDTKVKASLVTKKMKAKFTKAWTSFLRLPLSLDVYKEVLATIHQIVIPNLGNPVILCDFLTKSYDIGGVISVMALSGLYILMTKHGLEYPNFYTKLYALLTPDIFMAKYRARFFQLLDTSLKSAYLPAYLAAAFAKKLSRLALSVPPSGALVIIAIIHNLLRRHPSINFLVHKVAGVETDGDSSSKTMEESNEDGCDPFKFEESDPVKSDAMRSSLWEIETLRHHYCPAVSRFVASLENDLTIRNKTSEITVADFASGSYATIFGEEVRRRIKQVPLAFYRVIPTSLFSESDFPGWSFGDQPCEEQKIESQKLTLLNNKT